MRRAALRSLEDAKRAAEAAYASAQVQHAGKINELQNALMVRGVETLRNRLQSLHFFQYCCVHKSTMRWQGGGTVISRPFQHDLAHSTD